MKAYKIYLPTAAAMASLLMLAGWAGAAELPQQKPRPDSLDGCNVVWDSPSDSSAGSMPIGNGDIGMNVWVEPNGDLLLLISKTDAWDANGRILKVGRVRLSLTPTPLAKGKPFRQELKLRDGTIEISGGQGETATTLRVWVDANQPVIRVECEGAKPFDIKAVSEPWRTETRLFGENEWASCWTMQGSVNRKGLECYVTPDRVMETGDDRVIWYHSNESSVWPIGMKLQGLESMMSKMQDPLLNRTFGAALSGPGLARKDPLTLASSQPAKSHLLSIYPLTAITPTPQGWKILLDKQIKASDAQPLTKTRAEHQEWWQKFWQRSWIRISGEAGAEAVTRGYTLQRWMSACAGRGAYPFKFNGSIFTVEKHDGSKATTDPDFRQWGGDYWWQNVRLPYWPMLTSGDYDMMLPLFRMYLDTLPLAKERNKIWFNCEGAFIAETMNFWGLYGYGDYGWDRNGKQVGDVATPWIGRIWTGGLDLSLMMLDYCEHTQDQAFLKHDVLPWADAMVQYFDTRFKRDASGKLLITPGQALETYRDASVLNPTTDVAGLHAVIERLLALSPNLTDATARERWLRFQKELPDLPIAEKGGKKCVQPAAKFGDRGNCENPELYTVFPFRIFSVGKPNLELGRDTFAARIEKACQGWQQSAVQAAMLGLTSEAKGMLVQNAANSNGGMRFPATWGPNYDWLPDQCHGGNLLNTTQSMLMQTEGSKIYLFPAWPKEWNVSFKLHAPSNTTVEAELRDGKVTSIKVTPQSRAADVVNMLAP